MTHYCQDCHRLFVTVDPADEYCHRCIAKLINTYTDRPLRILITGTRRHLTRAQRLDVTATILSHCHRHGPGRTVILVHGDCPTGIDHLARSIGEDPNWPTISHEPHPADWDHYGRAAGPIRNAHMVKLDIDFCLAFPAIPSTTRGTTGCMELADKAGIPVHPYPIPLVPENHP